jgi:hypothetical protein
MGKALAQQKDAVDGYSARAPWPPLILDVRQAGKVEGLLCLLTLRYNGNMMNDTTWEKSIWH